MKTLKRQCLFQAVYVPQNFDVADQEDDCFICSNDSLSLSLFQSLPLFYSLSLSSSSLSSARYKISTSTEAIKLPLILKPSDAI